MGGARGGRNQEAKAKRPDGASPLVRDMRGTSPRQIETDQAGHPPWTRVRSRPLGVVPAKINVFHRAALSRWPPPCHRRVRHPATDVTPRSTEGGGLSPQPTAHPVGLGPGNPGLRVLCPAVYMRGSQSQHRRQTQRPVFASWDVHCSRLGAGNHSCPICFQQLAPSPEES